MTTRKTKILLVEDDKNLGFVTVDQLTENGFEVDWAKNGKAGLRNAINNYYDLAILDIMLPQLSGFEIAEELVEHKPNLPFLFLTAKSLITDKVKGLKLGEDYITKPFEIKELIARIENILSRSMQIEEVKEKEFTIGHYHFDYVNQSLKSPNQNKQLTKKEADLLRLLCLHINTVMPREIALKAIWGSDDYFNSRSMDVFISRLRKYLNDDDGIQLLNIHGVGFKLVDKSASA